MLSISYIKRDAVDSRKWDACIATAGNGNVYAYTEYLDCMAAHWDALIGNDYQYVMPLTWNSKYGFYYLYQPPFTASLGIFGNSIDRLITRDFIRAIPEKFRLVEIDLNAGNPVDESMRGILLRDNYILDLSPSYEQLRERFRQNVIRNTQKAVHAGCTYEKDIPLQPVIELSKAVTKSLSPLPEDAYIRFEKLYHRFRGQEKAVIRGVYTRERQLVASAVFFFSNGRAYYILVGNHPNGKTMGASHFLIDSFIKEFAGRSLVLDFEGSDIHGLAFFYSNFGAQIEKYPSIRENTLPSWVNWIRKVRP